MDQSTITEHDCNVLGGLFQIIISDLKNGTSVWEDFLLKASKLQTQLKATIAASTAFLDSFQKVADMATTTRGGTKEIGTSLTRLCLRQRSVEAKLKTFSSAFLDCLIIPLQDRIEEWKKNTLQLDKERTKELKRLRQEVKKRQICDSMTSNSFRSKKHSSRMSKPKYEFFESLGSKGIYGTIGNKAGSASSLSRSIDSEMECNERLVLFEELEKKAVRRALIEERSHFCLFVKFLHPVVEEEISMVQEISHIQEIMESLSKLTTDPFDLPSSSESVISGLKLNKKEGQAWSLQTPPSSPSSLGSRKSSMCSISSYNSSSSSSTYGQANQNKYFSLTHIPNASYGSGANLHEGQAETMFAKMSHTNRIYASNGCNDSSAMKAPDSDLQFPMDTDSTDANNPPIMISSTNPFLNSYVESQTGSESVYSGAIDPNLFSLTTEESTIYSEGSITPTNYEYKSSEEKSNDGKNSRSSKPPPAPPVRRTSSISNPNAITLGTLKNAGLASGNYDEICKNFSLYDEINVLTKSMNDINFSLKNTDFTHSPSVFSKNTMEKSSTTDTLTESAAKDGDSSSNKSDYQETKKLFENIHNHPLNQSKSIEDDCSQLPLPAPPPEAFMQTTTQNAHHYNKITNVHREFLETLNSKLSQSPLVYQSNTRVSKRRSSNQSGDEFNYVKPRGSTRSASATRVPSRKNSIENNVSQSYHGNFIDKLSQTLAQKQHNAEALAKAAATSVLHRKQSVPDLNELNSSNLRSQNRVTFSSSLNLSSPNQSFQVVQIQTNPTQQPIYASRTQLRKEIEELYGSLSTSSSIYGNTYQNGFFNKI